MLLRILGSVTQLFDLSDFVLRYPPYCCEQIDYLQVTAHAWSVQKLTVVMVYQWK